MKKNCIIFFTCFLFCSCGNQFYYPKPLEPVLLTHASQLKFNTVSTASPLNGLTAFSIAFSPKQNIGLQAGFTTGGGNTKTESSSGTITDSRREIFFIPGISAGYYTFLNKELFLEIYGGFGLYKYSNRADAFVKKLSHYDYFFQPSLAIINKNIEVAFTTRFDYLNRYDAATMAGLAPVGNDALKYKFLDYRNYLFFQPGITFKAGVKKIKGQLQFSHSYPLDGKYRSIYGTKSDYRLIKVGIGFTVDLDVKKKNK